MEPVVEVGPYGVLRPVRDVVIALKIASPRLAIDLMTGRISDDPLWPDTGNHVIAFKRGQS
jgi:hypothetical protein